MGIRRMVKLKRTMKLPEKKYIKNRGGSFKV
jgi:hypothetical protein